MTISPHIRLLYPRTIDLFCTLENEPGVRKYLDALSSHHHETYQHSRRASLLSVDLGYENNFEEADLRMVGLAGLLHDIGKIRLPVGIFLKAGPLDPEEREMISMHPRLGFLELSAPEFDRVKRIIVGHHEYKKDAYPRRGNQRMGTPMIERRNGDRKLSVSTQIVAVSDIYDGLASPRSYKGAFPLPEITSVIREQFTGDIVYVDQVLGRHPES